MAKYPAEVYAVFVVTPLPREGFSFKIPTSRSIENALARHEKLAFLYTEMDGHLHFDWSTDDAEQAKRDSEKIASQLAYR